MSSVGSTKANAILSSMGFVWVNGNKVYPIKPPEQEFPTVHPFPMHLYPNEVAATPHYLNYLQAELEKLGVPFGLGGFELVDVHANKELLQLHTALGDFKGYLDGVAVPFGIESYGTQMRLGLELKHLEQDKDIWKQSNRQVTKRKYDDTMEQGDDDDVEEDEDTDGQAAATGNSAAQQLVVDPSASLARRDPFKLTAKVKGQSVLQLLGSYSMAQYPIDIMVTDGHVCHIMRIRGKKVIAWEDLAPGQAICHLAAFLEKVDRSLVPLPLPPPTEPDEGREALEYLRHFHPLATILEQAEQLMELDDGSSRIQQAMSVMRLMVEQHGDDAITALVAPPPTFYQHIYG
eukprot:GHRR01008789.1.p1 GENE.GHRR01008789.1~~GHRR01008789.1.p1  ORF type:complete len:347 (+),score=112.71 GHRR01008789.1:909-1949(+)